MDFDQRIQIKKFVVKSLIPYDKRFNAFHDKKHSLTKENCEDMLNSVLKPILDKITKKEKEERAEHHWHFAGNETMKAKEDCRFMTKLFKACRTTLKDNPNYKIELLFN